MDCSVTCQAGLASPDLLVVNDSKVLPARLNGERAPRPGGSQSVKVEITLLRRLDGTRYSAFAKPARTPASRTIVCAPERRRGSDRSPP